MELHVAFEKSSIREFPNIYTACQKYIIFIAMEAADKHAA